MVEVTRPKDTLQAYYTKSDYITGYMVAMLELQNGMSVFDPCAGDGALTDAVLDSGYDVEVTAYELDQSEAKRLSQRYSRLISRKIRVRCCDTLLEPTDGIFSTLQKFDRIIANPPYGAWQDRERRKLLKKLFPGLYVRETYGLFLFKCLDLLNDHGRLVFIMPDTYLNLHLHEKLRARILKETAVEEIVVFPSKLFPDLSFGYANLSIITLRRIREAAELSPWHEIRIVKGLKNPSDFLALHGGASRPTDLEVIRVSQKKVYESSAHAFFTSSEERINALINDSPTTIDDVADVVTGFYSGDDRKYLRRASEAVRGSKRYELVDPARKAIISPGEAPSLEGIAGEQHFIPIVKGGAVKYVKPNDWFIDWSKEAVLDYRVRNKKARFQNSAFYFRGGLAVPMVTSSRITAALLENRLFDQSIVGVFPRDPSVTMYLLGFLNSDVCNDLIRTINPSANNSANYIKKLPFKVPTQDQKQEVETLVQRIIEDLRRGGKHDSSEEERMNRVFQEIYWPD